MTLSYTIFETGLGDKLKPMRISWGYHLEAKNDAAVGSGLCLITPMRKMQKSAEKCWYYGIFQDSVESGINEAVTVTYVWAENEGQNDCYSGFEFMPEYTEMI